MCSVCRSSASAAPAARSGSARRRRWRNRSPTEPCCFSSSNCARSPFTAMTATATSSPRHCLATARPRALLRCRGAGPAIVASGEYTWPASLDVMGWDIVSERAEGDFLARYSGACGRRARRRRGRFSRPAGTRTGRCRPVRLPSRRSQGHRRLRSRARHSRKQPARCSKAVLREFGNMSAATVLFVLERMLAAGTANWRRALITALGPGFTAGFTLLARQ